MAAGPRPTMASRGRSNMGLDVGLGEFEACMVDGLNPADPGLALLAEALRGAATDGVLCVCTGPIAGIRGATHLVLDVRELAFDGSGDRRVRADDSVAQLQGFDHAAVWPRAHLGKDFTEMCLARAAFAVKDGGHVWCAVRQRKGAESFVKLLRRWLGNVDVVARRRGYRLLRATKFANTWAVDELRACLERRYLISDPAIDVSLRSGPGVFSRRGLDRGTAILIKVASEAIRGSPSVIVDVGAGIGPLAIWAARHWPQSQVLAIESNVLAHSFLRDNIDAAGVGARVHAHLGDGMPSADAQVWGAVGRQPPDLALINPPTHAPRDQFARFVLGVAQGLKPHGQALWVVNRLAAIAKPLARSGAVSDVLHDGGAGGHVVVRSRWSSIDR